MCLGFAGAFRRSEFVALMSRTSTSARPAQDHHPARQDDQDGLDATSGIVRGSIACPVEALRAWVQAAGIIIGPLFRSIRDALVAPEPGGRRYLPRLQLPHPSSTLPSETCGRPICPESIRLRTTPFKSNATGEGDVADKKAVVA